MCDISIIISTAIVLFLSGFIGDIGTQIFAKFIHPHGNASLFDDYWKSYGRIGAATTAGLITLVFGGLMFLLALSLYEYGFQLDSTDSKGWTFVFFATCVGFILGMVADILTNRQNWIPSLRSWYDGVGETTATLWSGGVTFAFVLFITALWWRSVKR